MLNNHLKGLGEEVKNQSNHLRNYMIVHLAEDRVEDLRGLILLSHHAVVLKILKCIKILSKVKK